MFLPTFGCVVLVVILLQYEKSVEIDSFNKFIVQTTRLN